MTTVSAGDKSLPTKTEAPAAGKVRILDVPGWLQRSAAWSWRLLIIIATIAAFAWLFHRLRVVLVPILVAMMLASVMAPAVVRIQRRGVPKLVATWGVLLFFTAIIGGIPFLAGWVLSAELTNSNANWDAVGADVRMWLETGPLDLSPENVDELASNARQATVGGLASLGSTQAMLIIEAIAGLFLAAALTFFFVKDGAQMWAWIVRRVHPSRRAAFDEAGKEASATLAAFLKAVALTGFADALVIGLGLWVIGVPLVVPLAIITFFGAFLPVVGATAAGGLAAVVALVTNGPGDAALVILLTLIVQQLEGDILMPMIMGRQVPLHPAVVLAALAAGGALAGIVGAFVAVPIAAVATTAISVLRRHQRLEPAPNAH